MSLKCGDTERKIVAIIIDGNKVGFLCNDNSASMLSILSVIMVTCGHTDETNTKHNSPRDKTMTLLCFWHN